MYFSVNYATLIVALVKSTNGAKTPVYYISQTLRDTEMRYPRVDKLVYSLAITSCKLRHYFEGREIQVMTNQPLKWILHKTDMT